MLKEDDNNTNVLFAPSCLRHEVG